MPGKSRCQLAYEKAQKAVDALVEERNLALDGRKTAEDELADATEAFADEKDDFEALRKRINKAALSLSAKATADEESLADARALVLKLEKEKKAKDKAFQSAAENCETLQERIDELGLPKEPNAYRRELVSSCDAAKEKAAKLASKEASFKTAEADAQKEAEEAKGAAVATVISKVVIFVISISFFIFYKNGFPCHRENISLRLSDHVKHRMMRIGAASACEQLVLQLGATLTAKIISVLPTSQIAALQITSNLEALAWSTGDACCTSATALFGKSLGEGSEQKARGYLRLSEIWALLFSFAEILIFCFCGGIICRLFTNDTSIYGSIVSLLKITAVGLPFINTHKTVSGALRGAGDSVAPLISSLISLWIFRVLLGYILISVMNMGAPAYRWCLNVDQFVRMTAMLIFYFSGHWKKYTK